MASSKRAGLLLAFLVFLAVALAGPADAHRLGVRPAPTADSGPRFPFYFAVWSDTHWRWAFGGGPLDGIRNDTFLSAIVDTLNDLADAGRMDFLLFGGDWAHDVIELNAQANGDSFRAQLGRLKIPIYPTVGNHEIDANDTTAARPPHFTSTQRTLNFRTRFGANRWYRATWKNLEIYALNVTPDLPQLTNLNDYRDNNPTHYPSTVGGTVNDFDGISVPSSQQRVAFTGWLAEHDVANWEIGLFHRSIYGTDDVTSRKNYTGAMRGTGFLREWEIARPSTESFVCFTGDEHIFRIAKAGKDSTIAAAGAGGSYHVIYPTGSGMRSADMSDVFGADNSWILAQISRNVAGTANLGRTSVGVMDTLTAVGDPDLSFQCYWGIAKVIGDDIELSTYRTLCSRSAGANWYIGERHHLLVDRRTIHRDNRPY